MIDIKVELIENGKTGVKVNCNGCCTGKGDTLRREMVGALLLFDEIANGAILCDAFGEFLEEKMRKRKGDDSNE